MDNGANVAPVGTGADAPVTGAQLQEALQGFGTTMQAIISRIDELAAAVSSRGEAPVAGEEVSAHGHAAPFRASTVSVHPST
jgi:hypothetical protein